MRKFVLFCMAICLISFAATTCRAQDKIELFAGYSYVRGAVQVTPNSPLQPCPPNCAPVTQHVNLSGWEFSGTYKANPVFGVVADFSGHYGTLNGGSTHLQTYLFGPQVSLPARISPFGRVLFGVAHESVGLFNTPAFFSPGSDTAFASAFGGGIDMKAAPFLSLRLIQADYLRTRFYGHTQNQPRISTGLVLHF